MAGKIDGITRDTFKSLDQDGKLCTLFDAISDLKGSSESDHVDCRSQQKTCNQRFTKLENRKILHATAAASGGLFGGFIAVMFKKWFTGG
jgi:hypothetical protein